MGLEDSATAVAPRRAPRSAAPIRARPAALPADRGTPSLPAQMVRFAIVGVSNTVLSWVLFALAVHVGIWYPAASAGAFAAGAVNGYTLNRLWTFRAGKFRADRFARYVVVQLLGLGINELVLILLVEDGHVGRLLAQIVALFCVSVSTFFLNRQWAFAQPGVATD